MNECPECKGPYKLWNDYDNCVEFYECGWCHKREKIPQYDYVKNNLSKEKETSNLILSIIGIIAFICCLIRLFYNIAVGN